MTALFIATLIVLISLIMIRLLFRKRLREVSASYGSMRALFQYRSMKIKAILDYVAKFKFKEKDMLKIMYMMLERSYRSSDPEFIIGTECGMNIIMKTLLKELDSYPLIYEDQNYQNYKKAYYEVEERSISLALAYNEKAKAFNHMATNLPTNFVAELFHIAKQPTYSIDEETEELIKVAF